MIELVKSAVNFLSAPQYLVTAMLLLLLAAIHFRPLWTKRGGLVLLGSKEIGTDTLLRWYVLHVLMLPFVIVIFMAIHFWRVRKDGGVSGPL